MAEAKTKPTTASAAKFLASIKDADVRRDCAALAALMKDATKSPPKMWGPNIVGFGSRTIAYADGRKADWMLIAFSPRKSNLTLYVGRRFENRDKLLKTLGKHSTGGGCLYIKRMSDVDQSTLKKIVAAAVKRARKDA
ncbi:MAG TPA: DUF1801 domain-containing protein [Vicinamibacterales bacterium]|jgi:hypothetical protein